MNKRLNILSIGFLSIVFFSSISACSDAKSPVPQASADKVTMQVYKQASCGCCGGWVSHVENAGFDVTVTNSDHLDSIKKQFGIAPKYQSCHTGVAAGYVFEGHIPADLVKRFLSEKPEHAIGLAVPGMPVGSPGMEMGNRTVSYDVLLLKDDGGSELYARVPAGD